jgi:hypothetical protein
VRQGPFQPDVVRREGVRLDPLAHGYVSGCPLADSREGSKTLHASGGVAALAEDTGIARERRSQRRQLF